MLRARTRRVGTNNDVFVHHSPRQARRRPALRPAAHGARRANLRIRTAVGSDGRRDAQAGVPSTGWPRAQLAFKDSMVHGILQFTPSIAFRYVLHRCESLDIRCRESYRIRYVYPRLRPSSSLPPSLSWDRQKGRWRGPRRRFQEVFLGAHCAGVSFPPKSRHAARSDGTERSRK